MIVALPSLSLSCGARRAKNRRSCEKRRYTAMTSRHGRRSAASRVLALEAAAASKAVRPAGPSGLGGVESCRASARMARTSHTQRTAARVADEQLHRQRNTQRKKYKEARLGA